MGLIFLKGVQIVSEWLKKARASLERNPNIEKITEKNIAFTGAFKKLAVEEWHKGISPSEIFRSKGFDLSLFPEEYANDTLKRWRRSVKKNGLKALEEDRRGKSSSGRPRKKKSVDKMSEVELKARIAYLEAENDFLKKLRALAKQEK